jgi:hypothetical protein
MPRRIAIELFHLAFLAALGTALDKKLYAVKGGVNLRFFLGSSRSSEDLDLDVHTVEKGTLRRKVERLFESRPLEVRIAAKGLRIDSFTAPKQTETTQRWKVRLAVAEPVSEIGTRIEVSRRGLDEGVELGPVDPIVVALHGMSPVMAPHYGREAAFRQKVRALAGRTETQARDIFDLDFLLRGGPLPPLSRDTLDVDAAITNAMALSFDHFAGQVLPYLDDEEQGHWDAAGWDAAVLRVTTALEELS